MFNIGNLSVNIQYCSNNIGSYYFIDWATGHLSMLCALHFDKIHLITEVMLHRSFNGYDNCCIIKIVIHSQDAGDDDVDTLDPPKVLADIVESLVGAVFLDSNKDLARVWSVFQPLFQPFIGMQEQICNPNIPLCVCIQKNSPRNCQCLQLGNYWKQTLVVRLHLGKLVNKLLLDVVIIVCDS